MDRESIDGLRFTTLFVLPVTFTVSVLHTLLLEQTLTSLVPATDPLIEIELPLTAYARLSPETVVNVYGAAPPVIVKIPDWPGASIRDEGFSVSPLLVDVFVEIVVDAQTPPLMLHTVITEEPLFKPE
jgi:hypothetical protein